MFCNTKRAFILILILGSMVASCAAPMNKNFPLIETGMSMAEVESLVGKPISAESGPDDTKIFYFRLASSYLDTDGSDTREYYVASRFDEVVAFGERVDDVTAERAERQFDAGWNAARSASAASANVTNESNANVNAPATVQTYLLSGQSFDAVRGKTICTYRQAGGNEYRVKELIGDFQCPGTYF